MFEELLRIEIVVPAAGLVCAAIAGFLVDRRQRERASVLPYLPSHAEALSTVHDPATRFFAAVHEMTMAVIEAWNAVHARSKIGGSVESALHKDVLLPACDQVRSAARELREDLANYAIISVTCQQSIDAIDTIWNYRTQHNYRTETYTTTTTDADGKTQTHINTRQVYDNTDHRFELDRAQATSARQPVVEVIQQRDIAHLPVPNVRRAQVRLDRIDEAERMFLRRLARDTVFEDADKNVDDKTLSRLVNQWVVATGLDGDLNRFHARIDQLERRYKTDFATIESSEDRYAYNTGSSTHEGPPGYGAAEGMLVELEAARIHATAAFEVLNRCTEVADRLSSWATDNGTIESDRTYVFAAIDAYEAAFPKSELDLNQLPKSSRTLAFATAAGIVGSGITWLAFTVL